MKNERTGIKAYGDRVAVILLILFINFCLIVPVWQSSVNREIELGMKAANERINDLEEAQRMLIASATYARDAEILGGESYENSIQMAMVSPSQVVRIVSDVR